MNWIEFKATAAFAGLLALTLSPTAEATIVGARPYYIKVQSSSCHGSVRSHLSKASSGQFDFPSIEKTAKSCFEIIKAMTEELNKVGSTFKDSDNMSWASSAKRDAVRATSEARQSAEVLRTVAYKTMNPKQALTNLDKKLKKAYEEFNDLNGEHKKRLSKLAKAVDEIGRKWKAEAKDDLPAYDRAVEKAVQARKELFELQKKAYQQSQELSESVDDAEDVWPKADKKKISKAYKEMFVEMRKTTALDKQVAMKYKAYQEALKKVEKEWDRFVKEAKKTSAFMTDDVTETVDRMSEFAKEYTPF